MYRRRVVQAWYKSRGLENWKHGVWQREVQARMIMDGTQVWYWRHLSCKQLTTSLLRRCRPGSDKTGCNKENNKVACKLMLKAPCVKYLDGLWTCGSVKEEQRCKSVLGSIKMIPRGSWGEKEENMNMNISLLLKKGFQMLTTHWNTPRPSECNYQYWDPEEHWKNEHIRKRRRK